MMARTKRMSATGMMAVACYLTGVAYPASHAWAQEGVAVPTPVAEGGVAVAPVAPKTLGSASCSASNCHGGTGRPGSKGSEFTTWVLQDPHRQAYKVLLDERSRTIAANLKLPVPAHKWSGCLVCHASVPADPALHGPDLTASMGVGCEGCHGAAEHYLAPHTTAGWKSMPAEQKQAFGMFDTKSLASRAVACTGCHIGDADREVNHDLIAAGHPRLSFEFSAYQELEPRHWPRRASPGDDRPGDLDRYPDFSARSWKVGQVAAAHAAVALLEVRATRAGQGGEHAAPWPELTEFDCFACHHDLGPAPGGKGISWRQARGYTGASPAGSVAWGTWYTTVLTGALAANDQDAMLLTASLTKLEGLIERPQSTPAVVAGAAKEARLLLEKQLAAVEATPFTATDLKAVVQQLNNEKVRSSGDWDGATQSTLALAAYRRALRDGGPVPEQWDRGLTGVLTGLRFPASNGTIFDSPREFTPESFQQQIQGVMSLLP
jgi:hypothetical protein